MTVDDIITEIFRERGYSEDQISTWRRGADRNPLTVEFGDKPVPPAHVEGIKNMLRGIMSLPAPMAEALKSQLETHYKNQAKKN